MDRIQEEAVPTNGHSTAVTNEAVEHALSHVQELRSVWDGVQAEWTLLLEAEASSHYDSLQRDELTTADEQLSLQFPAAVLSFLEAVASSCIDLLLQEQEMPGANSDQMLQALRQLLVEHLSALDKCVPTTLRQAAEEAEAVWLTADALAQQAAQAPVLSLAAHVWLQSCFHMHASGSFLSPVSVTAPLESVLCSVELPVTVASHIPAKWAQLANSHGSLLPDALQISEVCHAMCLSKWARVDWSVTDGSADELLDPSEAVQELHSMAQAARTHSAAFLEVTCRLRLFNWHCGAAAAELGALQEDRAMGLGSAARELCEALFLACDFAADPLAVCGGDSALLSQIQQKQSFALYKELQRAESDDVDALLAQLHATETRVLRAAQDAAPRALAEGPTGEDIEDVDEFLCGLHDVEDWGALLSAACQLALDNQAELIGRQLPKGTATQDILQQTQDAVQAAAHNLQQFSQFCHHAELRERYAECASQLSALQSGMRLQYAALLKADNKHLEIAEFMERELQGLMDGSDAIAQLQLDLSSLGAAQDAGPKTTEDSQHERLQRRQQLSRVREVTLFALRCSTAWAALKKWDDAERIILRAVAFLKTMQHESGVSSPSELTAHDLQHEFQLLPLEAAVLQSMAWTQLARALRAQGHEARYVEIINAHVLGSLGEQIVQHGELLLQMGAILLSEPGNSTSGESREQEQAAQRARTLACAMYHTAQQTTFAAIEELLKPRADLNSVESLFEAYSNLEQHTPVVRQWSALADTLASQADNLRSISGAAASSARLGSSTAAAASSPSFIWQLPSSGAEIRNHVAQVEFWSGKLMQHSAYLLSQQEDTTVSFFTRELQFKLRRQTVSHQLVPRQCQNLDVALWHFRQALEQTGLLGTADACSPKAEPELWCFECAHLFVQETVRYAAVSTVPCADAAEVQANVDWVTVESLCRQVLQLVSADIYDANPRLQVAVAGLQRHQTMALCHVSELGVDAALEYGSQASKRTQDMMHAAMKSLHLLEDEGANEALLAKVGRSVLQLQQLAVAHVCDLTHLAATIHRAQMHDSGSIHGNKLGQLFSSALQCVETAARYQGIETAYPESVLCGFALLTWRPQLQVMRSHVQVLLQLVFDTAFMSVTHILGENVWQNDATAHSPHKVLRRESELLFSLEGAVDDVTTFAYTSGPSADAAFQRSRIASLQTRSSAPSFLMCAGVLHKLAVWLETQQGFATASPASRASYYNAVYLAGNAFRMVGNEAGEQRSRTKAAEALRQSLEYYTDPHTKLEDEERQALVRGAREALAESLDELGVCLMASQLHLPALEAFLEGRDTRVVLYTSTAGDSAHSAKFNNSHYVWVTLAGMVEASLRCQRHSMAVDIAQEQLQLLQAAGASDSFWCAIAMFAWGRALVGQGYLETGYAKLKETADWCHLMRDSVNDATCSFTTEGAPAADAEAFVWGAPGSLYAEFKPAGISPARMLFDVQLRCLWQMAETARCMFKLQTAMRDFDQWRSVQQQEEDCWQQDAVSLDWTAAVQGEGFDASSIADSMTFARDVEAASIAHGLAAVHIQLGNADEAMEALQSSREQHLQTQGMLSKQYTACVVDIARHFLTYSSDPHAAIDFLQHPLGLLCSCLAECKRRQGHRDSDSSSAISESDESEGGSGDDDSDDDDFSTGIFAKGSSLVGAPVIGGELAVLNEADEEDDTSSDDEPGSSAGDADAGKRSSPKRSKASEMLQRAQLTRFSGAACLQRLQQSCIFGSVSISSALAELTPPAPVDVDAAEAVDWQLQLGGTVDDMALDLLAMQLQRQVSAIMYHIGLALALEGGLPHPPQPLDCFDDISVQPQQAMVELLQESRLPTNKSDDLDEDADSPDAASAAVLHKARLAAAAWYRSLQVELQVRSASTQGEFTPSVTAIKSIARLGQLLHAAAAETDTAIAVLSLGCRWLLQFPALSAAAERNVAPVLWICLSACKACQGDFHGSAAAGGLCIDGLRNAKSEIDERDGVDLMSAMQSMSLMAQYECLALCFQARVYLEQDMPDTALACLRAADRTLQQYTSASSPHTARILYWDARIVSIQRAVAELYETVGDAVKAEQVAATAVRLEEEREAEGDAVTAAVAAAAREGLW